MARTKKCAAKKSGKKGDPEITKEKETEPEEEEQVAPRKRRGRPTKAEQFMKRTKTGELTKDKRPEGHIEKIAIGEFLHSYEHSAIDYIKRTYEYEDEIKKMMHSFGDTAHPQTDSANILEALAHIYLKHTMEQLVQETLKRHIRKNKQKKLPKNFYKQRVDLDEVTLNLTADKRARVKDVVSFLRRNKKIERTTQAVEEGWFEDEQDYDEDAILNEEATDVKEEKVTLDNFWDSVVVGEAQDKAKERKLERLRYRDSYSKNMPTQEYLYFAECTKVSFTRPAKRTKFITWSKLNTYPISFGNECVDVIGQLVYEFVEEIIRGVLNGSQALAQEGVTKAQILDFVKNKFDKMVAEETLTNGEQLISTSSNEMPETTTTTTTTTTEDSEPISSMETSTSDIVQPVSQ